MILTLVLFYLSSGHELTTQPHELDYVCWASHWSELSQWWEKINLGLALFEIDKAIMDKRPVELTLLNIPNDLSVDAKAEREK
jgi:hypothetical protein